MVNLMKSLLPRFVKSFCSHKTKLVLIFFCGKMSSDFFLFTKNGSDLVYNISETIMSQHISFEQMSPGVENFFSPVKFLAVLENSVLPMG